MAWTNEDLEAIEQAIVSLAKEGQEVRFKDRSYRKADLSALLKLRDIVRKELGLVKRKVRTGVFDSGL